MSNDRCDLISDLYHRALARAPEERAAFLVEACTRDDGLRQEVESLLEYEPASAQFLETPAVIDASIALSIMNRQIGSYTIVAPLGAGGAWTRSIARATAGSDATWRSRCCRRTSPPIPSAARARHPQSSPQRRDIQPGRSGWSF